MNRFLLKLGIFFYGFSSYASFHSNCVETEYTLLTSKLTHVSECKMAIPLNLTETYFTYPKMNFNPRRVEVWEGAYKKILQIENVYLKELIDVCRGRVISEKQITEKEKQILTFSVMNPNLDSSISESYLLAPMTEQEAQSELKRTWKRCQRSSSTGTF